ncbi:MAG TPA: YMGG-like glycine zipper-containing protein [Dongiaceae bacterium]|nr:YMGG-like glycine zipper-containing protein [Dongiaceae bacterium]
MRSFTVAVAALALLAGGCTNMSTTEQRVLTGGAIGAATGAAVGAIASGGVGAGVGAAVGGAVGAAGGYVYDQVVD